MTRCQNLKCDYPLPEGQRECPCCGAKQLHERTMTAAGGIRERRLSAREAISAKVSDIVMAVYGD
jgi:hypothetical protein